MLMMKRIWKKCATLIMRQHLFTQFTPLYYQKPSLIDANINSAIMAMLDIVQPKNDNVDEDATSDEVFPHEKYARNQPIIPVSRESNEPIVEWTVNKSLMIGAFPDKFCFGQGVPNRLPTQQNWKHFSLYYDG
jgi:hypothetical protein